MYVAVKGGERAIEASWRLLDKSRRGDTQLAELSVAQIREQLRLAVARVMTEGSVYDEELAALAIKQAAGDLVEAIFLLRAYRTTLPRFGYTQPLDSEAMRVERRISATFKDVPGGQLLGATYDYTQRLLDFALLADAHASGNATGEPATVAPRDAVDATPEAMPRVVSLLNKEGLIEQERPTPEAAEPGDLTREPLAFPASRATRLQNLARGDEGFLLAMGYATQRGYAHSHPFAGEIRFGSVTLEMELDELGEAVEIGEIDITECQMINQFAGSGEVPPTFTQGYGLTFGHCERKAMAMALVDRALRAEELGETIASPTQDIEFMLSHSDSVEASGFVQHLKLPHYVDFQAELELVRRLRAQHVATSSSIDSASSSPDATETAPSQQEQAA
ncbi:carbon-phosphorus lyase complex subunit PhnI [Paraburkholderia sp. DHOC27]|uniref:carbon-phosphorus lyase complex subunit PhnI n=1 Tax=Paraburkholderia sp. DHOC27 TaxID=2303330 RepID=UPI000E3CDD7F|nr:carbon-phosphorus lyase complex subunit PhnI [Paraburkholderia sp. DHOC27]RFU49441.1 carbon-phosphorus lyase complex subunit PhnI [Paraburkholderia sp. DHOC27]